ncbi:MAG: hydroxymethylglutaryl-CoA lyase [Bacteroidota bacterium]
MSSESEIKITESPRDAMQGMTAFIPTEKKAAYINALLQAGFDTIDFGSFVSPKVIPQMADTAEVLARLNFSSSSTQLMALAASARGIEKAASHEAISKISFPFSASPEFLKLNTGLSIDEALDCIDAGMELCDKTRKEFVVYLTMAFGNPYEDKWDPDLICEQVFQLQRMGIRSIPLSDITGEADEQKIHDVYSLLMQEFEKCEFGLHLHSDAQTWRTKLDAAWACGCRSFDTVLGGFGGCPMTGKELMGNLNTLDLLGFCKEKNAASGINLDSLAQAVETGKLIFDTYNKTQE